MSANALSARFCPLEVNVDKLPKKCQNRGYYYKNVVNRNKFEIKDKY